MLITILTFTGVVSTGQGGLQDLPGVASSGDVGVPADVGGAPLYLASLEAEAQC